MRQYIDIFDKKWDMECMGCAITNGEMDVPGGILHETKYFQIHQDPTNPIPGFLIISLKRHIGTLLEFTCEEKDDYSKILYEARNSLKNIVGIKFCTIIQEERAPHFHAWVLPYYNWMNEVNHGTIDEIIPLLKYSKQNWKTPDKIKKVIEVAEKIKEYFENIEKE
jgi:diadenosine tetraphosphate (Ap4A) HIT family hydrolase